MKILELEWQEKKELKKKKNVYQKAAKRNKLGWHSSKKSIYYTQKTWKEVYLHSSYEVQVAKDLDKHDVIWERPNYLLWSDIDNISHRYYPDFYLPKYNIYLDPKNDYLINIEKEKIDRVCTQNNVRVLILSKENLTWNKIKKLI